MSEQIGCKTDSGIHRNRKLQIKEFWGGQKNGKMIQLTQGLGVDLNDPGFVQLNQEDIDYLVYVLRKNEFI